MGCLPCLVPEAIVDEVKVRIRKTNGPSERIVKILNVRWNLDDGCPGASV